VTECGIIMEVNDLAIKKAFLYEGVTEFVIVMKVIDVHSVKKYLPIKIIEFRMKKKKS
jgi:hypothetical protein